MLRGIRGAIQVKENTHQEITKATQELFLTMLVKNNINVEDIAFIIFTSTNDLDAAFPSFGVRSLGKPFSDLATIDMPQMNVKGSLPKTIRALMLVNTEKDLDNIIHPYLKGAEVLRPDRYTG